MSRYAITTLGPAAKLGAAAIPLRALPAQAYQSRGVIAGSPGTVAIPAPPPGMGAIPQDKTALATGGGYHRSSQAPAIWYPGVYYERNGPGCPPERAPVSVLSDNQLPMPAINPLGAPAAMMGRPRLGGQFSVPNRAAVPAYPPLSGGA